MVDVLDRIDCFDNCLKDKRRDNDLPFSFLINVEIVCKYSFKLSIVGVLVAIFDVFDVKEFVPNVFVLFCKKNDLMLIVG